MGEYFAKLEALLTEFTRVFVVSVDNVGSNQMQQIRIALRGKAEVLMGKNTMMRKVFKNFIAANPGTPMEALLPYLVGNVGLVFTNGDLGEVREAIETNRVPAPARVGAIAPIDVVVPKGPTGCDPGQTSFFQTLQIATKITKGQIEMTNDTHLIVAGDKVTASQVALLQKLNIEPFQYGLQLKTIYDNGSVFSAKVLDVTEDVLVAKFSDALSKIASLSLVLGYPTQASIPHSIANAFKMLLAITVECPQFSFDKADPYKALVCPKADEGGDE